MTALLAAGFLHSDSRGSLSACDSPRHFAAYHVLLRLLMPRHSLCALYSLTFDSSFQLLLVVFPFPFRKSPLYYFLSIAFFLFNFQGTLVGSSGLEPPTSRLSGVCSNHLSYEPMPSSLKGFPFMVEMRRLELLTPCVQGRCSPI